MFAELLSLGLPAVAIGFVHCVCGPDHYVPFVAMSRVGLWSLRKTLLITFLCGVGHVIGSAAIGFIGISLGLIVSQLQGAESVRGDIAAWMLFGFGVAYTLWGLYHAWSRPVESTDGRPVSNSDIPAGGELLAADGAEPTTPASGHLRLANWMKKSGSLTPWILFVIFLFGPCEPLIPMLMVPASQANMLGVFWVTLLFGLTTITTMTALVTLIYLGTFATSFSRFQRWGHVAAGTVVCACGASILFLGL